MTKRTSAKYKIDRRMGENIWGRPKSPVNKREYGPGQHGQRRKGKLSDFGTQLRAKQKLKGYYVLLMQLRGVIEWLATRGDWFLFRQLTRYAAEFPRWRDRLSRPGRLTAGMNYYRANLGALIAGELPSARVPVFGVWSSGDLFLVEGQMIASERYVRGPWRYACIEGANHWLQLDAPRRFNPLLLEYLGLPLASA